MKNCLCIVLLCFLLGVSANAQSSYEEGMQKAFQLLENNRRIEAGDLFERIAKAEKENWLPYYYASQLKIIESFATNDVVKKEVQLKEAQLLLDEAHALSEKENVEVMVLQAMLHTSSLTIDPATYGMKLSPVINRIYEIASEKAPGNPRVLLAKTEWEMGSARFFGEDAKNYCGDLKASLQLFAELGPEVKFYPAWGEDRAKKLIANTCGDADQD